MGMRDREGRGGKWHETEHSLKGFGLKHTTNLLLYVLTTLSKTKTILLTTPSLEREREREREREKRGGGGEISEYAS